MKIELEKITLGVGLISENVFAGVLNKRKDMWIHKVDVTNSFIDSVIKKYEGKVEVVSSEEGTWEISVKKVKK